MSKGILITGTDTDVGKTFVSCLIAKELKESGARVGVMKPTESDCQNNNDRIPKDSLALKEASGTKTDIDIINPYRFKEAISPNVAAHREGIEIDIDRIIENYKTISDSHDRVVIEGSGGLMVPFSDKHTIIDLALEFNWSVIIVAASKLGVINHTFLTVYTAKQMGLNLKGIVLNHTTEDSDHTDDYNLRELEKTKLPVIDLPYLKDKFPPSFKTLF